MANKGFQNAPGVTEFRRGQRFAYKDEWFNVVFVDAGGNAHCKEKETNGGQGELSWFMSSNINLLTLDLDGIWVGREYYGEHKLDTCRVLLVDDEVVAYQCKTAKAVVPRSEFLGYWKPLPLDAESSSDGASDAKSYEQFECARCGKTDYVTAATLIDNHLYCGECVKPRGPIAPQSVNKCDTCQSDWHNCGYCTLRVLGQPVTSCGGYKKKVPSAPAQPWTPEVGQSHLTQNGTRVTVLAVDGGDAWAMFPTGNRFTMPIGELRPLPPEPPVKCPFNRVGDVVDVTISQTQHYFGMVVDILNWPEFTIKWATGRDGHTKVLRYEPGMEIRCLVPAPQEGQR